MADKQFLQLKGNTWRVVVEIPKHLREAAKGKPRFLKSLGTESLSEANRLKHSYVAEFKRRIRLLEQGKADPLAAAIEAAIAFKEAFATSDNETLVHGDQESTATSELLDVVNREAEEGRSLPADIFIVLPKDREGDEVLKDIVADMPGLNVMPWDFEMDGPKVRQPRKGSCHEALLSYMTVRLPGSTPMSKIARDLGIKPHALKALRDVLRNPAHALTKALHELGVTYDGGGVGRGARSVLTKQQPT